MVRTQIYLTEEERSALQAIAYEKGKKLSELIRQAVDGLIAQHPLKDREVLLRNAKGLWKDRQDLPDFRSLRIEFDRLESSEN